MTNRGTKRALALCLSLALLLGMLPTAAFAAGTDGPCENHPVYDTNCGYIEAVAGAPCKHALGEHDDACGYTEGTPEIPCDLGCTELDEAGAVRHAADCAYTPAVAGTPCAHLAEERHKVNDGEAGREGPLGGDADCGYVAAVEGHPCGHACELCAPEDSDGGASGRDAREQDGDGASDRDTQEQDGGPAPLSAPAPIANDTVTAGAFQVTGDASGYRYENNTLTIQDGADLTIQNTNPNTSTEHKIVVKSGVTADITLAGVNIDVSGTSRACAFDMSGAEVALNLADGSDNILKSGDTSAGLEAPNGSKLTIGGTGKLEATGGDYGAGIGGGYSKGGGTITINDGTVKATGSYYGAGIGGGYGDGGTITVNGGSVTATSSKGGAGIGGGGSSSGGGRNGGIITVNGGSVTATSSKGGAGIGGGYGGGSGGDGGDITIQNNAVVFATGSDGADHIGGGIGDGHGKGGNSGVKKSGGVIFESTDGKVYGDLTIPDGFTLTIPDGFTLTNDHTLTNNGTIDGPGTLTGGGDFNGTGTYTTKVTRAIAPPTLKSSTQTSVTLNAVTPNKGDGIVEYARSDTNTTPTGGWQIAPTFDGLTPSKTYYFFARVTGSTIYMDVTSDGKAITTASVAPVYSIQATPAALDFGTVTVGYTPPAEKTVTVENTGNQCVMLNQPTATNYTLGALSKTELSVGETATFTVQPKPDLAKNTYSENVTVSNTQGQSVSISLSFTVTDKPTYAVMVNGGTGGSSYEAGAAVTITATVPDGKRFKEWTIAPSVTFTSGGKNTETATFTMPAGAVTATANFENKTSGDGGGGKSDSSGSSYASRTLTDKPTGIVVKGSQIHESATLTVETEELHKAGDAGCDLLRAAREAGHLLGAWDVSLSRGFRGNVTVSLPVEGRDGQTLTVAHCMDGKLTLSNVKVSGGFAKVETDGLSPFAVLDGVYTLTELEALAQPGWENPFADVDQADWFYDAVEYVHQKSLMAGTGEAVFSPNGPVTRAQVWTVLARLDGADTTGGAPWYAPAQDWAVEKGVSDGANPDGAVSREQLVTMLYRYAQNAGMDVSVGGNTNILSYTDAFDVAEWAIPAFQWACGSGVVSGTGDTTLSPQAGATRAQLAAILMRALEHT